MRLLRLTTLAKRLGWKRDHIVKTLKKAGYGISNSPIQLLNEKHLQTISHEYRRSMRSKRKYAIKQYDYLSLMERVSIEDYFSQFLQKTDVALEDFSISKAYFKLADTEPPTSIDSYIDMTLRNFAPADSFYLYDQAHVELDDALIDEYFYDLAYGVTDLEREFRLFKKHYRIWAKQYLLRYNFSDQRQKILTLILHNHYHIFTSEEDNTGVAPAVKNPSTSGNFFRPVGTWLNRIIINLTQPISWIALQKISSLST